jgi:hypothetical protein
VNLNIRSVLAASENRSSTRSIPTKISTQISLTLLITGLCCGLRPAAAAQAGTPGADSTSHEIAEPHDGQHDFDFEIGNWRAHVKKLTHPLSGSKDWEEFDGTVVTTPFMDRHGNLSEMNVDNVTSHNHIQIIAVRLYNPNSRQWSIYGASVKTGVFDPPQIGAFQGRRGEFYASDTFQGRAIYIRFVWQDLGPAATHFEQAFSSDGGKTWEVNWIYDGTRLPGNVLR